MEEELGPYLDCFGNLFCSVYALCTCLVYRLTLTTEGKVTSSHTFFCYSNFLTFLHCHLLLNGHHYQLCSFKAHCCCRYSTTQIPAEKVLVMGMNHMNAYNTS